MLGIIPIILPQCMVWKLKTCAKTRKILQGRMSLLIFLSRLQIENYVMTPFSIQPIATYGQQTIFPHLRVAVAKFQYPCVNGLYSCYCFSTKFEDVLRSDRLS